MIIAQQKRKENIIEYVLYMWYIEDMVRANGFDMNRIRQNVISNFGQPAGVLQQIDEWYQRIISGMNDEDLQKGGHLNDLVELVHQLNDLHLNLINDLNQPQYRQAYYLAEPHISELKKKSKPGITEIEACLNGLYMLMLMRIKGAKPASGTTQAMETFSNMLAQLNHRYFNPDKSSNN